MPSSAAFRNRHHAGFHRHAYCEMRGERPAINSLLETPLHTRSIRPSGVLRRNAECLKLKTMLDRLVDNNHAQQMDYYFTHEIFMLKMNASSVQT